MSDAQLRSDAVDGENDPSLQSPAHPGDAGTMAPVRLDALGDGLPADESASAPDADAGESDPVPDAAVPSAEAHAPPGQEPPDDLQPMLDLRFPDSPPLASSSPGEVISLTSEPFDPYLASPSQPELGPAAFDLEVSAPLEANVSGQRSHSDAGGAAAAVDIPVEIVPVEISPIFSALDAAERDAEAVRQREPVPEPETFDSAILLPRSQWSEIEEEPVAPALSSQATELPAADPPEIEGDAGSITEAAASPETPQEQDAPPHADEQAPPSEILQDAAARIAAEASATAAALENLKRLLVDNRPEPEIAVLHNLLEASPERTEPPPIPVYRPPARLPITPPPMVEPPQATASLAPFPDEDLPPRRPVAAVGSFFAGFALSWVLGAVLYVFLTG